MKIDFELTEIDYEKIAEKTIQKLSDTVFINKVIELSSKLAEDKYWHVFKELHSKVEMNDLLKKHMSGLILSCIKEGNLLTTELNKLVNSEDIKRLTSQSLRLRARQLDEEADELLNP